MNQKLLFLIAIVIVTTAFQNNTSIIGKPFPSLACETSLAKQAAFPEVAKGKYTLVGIAFSQESQAMLKTWMQPVYDQFFSRPPKQEDDVFNPGLTYDLNLYFIPMFTGINKAVSKPVKEKIIKNTDKEFHKCLLFYKGDNTFKEELNIDKKELPYFYVLDKKGIIRYATSGKYEEKKIDEIIAVLDAGSFE